jgi:hypothetical protein
MIRRATATRAGSARPRPFYEDMMKINDGALFVDLDDTLAISTHLASGGKFSKIIGQFPSGGLKKRSEEAKRIHSIRENMMAMDREDLVKEAESIGIHVIGEGPDLYLAKVRPGAVAFLQEAKRHINDIYILTTGGIPHQTAVAEACGLLDHVDGLLNLASRIPKYRWPILVDDLGISCSGVMAKMEQIGVVDVSAWASRDAATLEEIEKHFCQIPYWDESNYEEDVFKGLIPRILEKLGDLVRS